MKHALSTISLLFAFPVIHAQQDPVTTALAALHTAAVHDDGPGAAVLVARGNSLIYRGARGLADLELGVPLGADHVFRIGSITKQFTAVAVLQLVEQGLLGLDDGITKHIPELTSKGEGITVEMLLNHTSGIKSYTSMPAFDPWTQKRDVEPEGIMAFFINEPLEFEPGTKWSYSNSGYVLLGILIERLSGKGYAEHIEGMLATLGMGRSSYGRDEPIVTGRAKGYRPGPEGFVNAPYLSMSWPYAAGALQSTVDDLHTWNNAVFGGRLVSAETLAKAHTPHVLPSGKDTRYGHGWMMANVQGVRSVEHGGGINGFVTHALYLPEEDLYVVVLANREGDLAPDLAARLAATAIGKPYVSVAVPMDARTLASYAGVYVDDEGNERFLRMVDGTLTSQRSGGRRFVLGPVAKDEFFFEGSLTRMGFQRDRKGRVTGLVMRDRTFGDTPWKRTDKPLPAGDKATPVEAAQIQRLTGEYELAPGFTITVTATGDQLFAQATGQQRFEVYPRSPLEFFYTVVDARLEFHLGADGKAEKLVLFQGGQELPGRRVR